MPEEMRDLSAAADKLLKDKIECVTPVPISEYESMCYNIIHYLNLPTITEIYKEVGLLVLKYAVGIGLFLAGWWLLSCILDEVAMMFGY